MEDVQIDRRANVPGVTRIVREGVLLQAWMGTVGAVEFLKAHAVSGAVIRRVLGHEQLRQGDQQDQVEPAHG